MITNTEEKMLLIITLWLPLSLIPKEFLLMFRADNQSQM